MLVNTQIHLTKENSNVAALVTATINDYLVIKGIRVIEGKNGTFVSMPSYKSKSVDSEYIDFVHPSTKEAYVEFKTAILSDYKKELKTKEIGEKMQKITPIKCHVNIFEKDNIKALANVEIAEIKITGIKILDGKNGLYISMPQIIKVDSETQKKTYTDIVYPNSKIIRDRIQELLLVEYKNILQQEQKKDFIVKSNKKVR